MYVVLPVEMLILRPKNAIYLTVLFLLPKRSVKRFKVVANLGRPTGEFTLGGGD